MDAPGAKDHKPSIPIGLGGENPVETKMTCHIKVETRIVLLYNLTPHRSKRQRLRTSLVAGNTEHSSPVLQAEEVNIEGQPPIDSR